MNGLERLLSRLDRDGIEGEVWIDGSFVTEKIDAQDVDLVLCIQASFYDSATTVQRDTVDWLSDDLMPSHECDSNYFMEYPEQHPLHWIGEYMHAYWMKQWGFSRRNELKGFAVVELTGGSP